MGRDRDDGCGLLVVIAVIAFLIGRCTVEERQPVASWPGTPVPESADDSSRTYYATCSEARADGVTPLYEGDDGYAPHLDRDRDGIACEN